MTLSESPEVPQNGSEPQPPPAPREAVPVPDGIPSRRRARILTALRTVPEHGGDA